MYMVVILHILGCGGILWTCEKFSLNYYVAWFLETSAYCAVDVFAMISGYVMVNAKFNGFRIIPLYLTVLFYSAIITLLFRFLPMLSSFHEVTIRELIKGVCIPVVSQQYWYFSAYVGMYFFIPFMNKMILSLSKNEYTILCLTIIAIFSLLPVVGLKMFDTFNTGGGYTTIWLICCYFIGAYFKKFPITLSKVKCILLYTGSIFCAWFAKFLSHVLLKLIFSKDTELDLFIDYTSVFIIISGIALLLLFSQINIKSSYVQKNISFISNLAFSVYIIHVQPLIFNYILKYKFADLAFDNPFFLLLKVFLGAFLIFLLCVCIDIFRYFIFKILKINDIPRLCMHRFFNL